MTVYITRRASGARRGIKAGERVFARRLGQAQFAEEADIRKATAYESIAAATRDLPASSLYEGWAPWEHSNGGS